MRTTGERGQAAPLMAAIVVLVGMLALLTVRVAGAAVERARARTAADAAALAGAMGGRSSALELAAENGGALESFAEDGAGAVEVVVRVGRARAAARARADGEGGKGGGAPAADVAAAFDQLSARLGRRVRVTKVRAGGAGVEVGPGDRADIDRDGPEVGLCRPSPRADPALVTSCAPGG